MSLHYATHRSPKKSVGALTINGGVRTKVYGEEFCWRDKGTEDEVRTDIISRKLAREAVVVALLGQLLATAGVFAQFNIEDRAAAKSKALEAFGDVWQHSTLALKVEPVANPIDEFCGPNVLRQEWFKRTGLHSGVTRSAGA